MYSGSTLIAIQLSRNLLLVVNVPIHASFNRVQNFAHGAILEFWQANARAQAKVARAHAQVCRGYTTGYHLCDISSYLVRGRDFKQKSVFEQRQSICWSSKVQMLLLMAQDKEHKHETCSLN